jgi:hypothetical protein
MVQDILDRADELEVEMSKDAARRLLESIEKRLAEAMTEAGWMVIEDAIVTLPTSGTTDKRRARSESAAPPTSVL